MPNKNNKTIIIVHGGALKSAFAAGVVYGLSNAGIKTADVILGTSSSVPTMAYFASGQFSSIRNIWRNEVGSKKFIKYSNLLAGEPVFDINYLIEEVFKKKHPLHFKDIVRSERIFLIPLYDYEEGRLEFYDNHRKNFEHDFWDILRAAITIHNKHIANGRFHKFVDADLDPFAVYRKDIVPENWNVLVIMNHKNLDFNLKRWLGLRFFSLLQSRNFPQGVKDKLKIRDKLTVSGLGRFESFKKRYKPVIIYPSAEVKLGAVSVMDRSGKNLRYLFKMGEKTAEALTSGSTRERLEVFVKRSKELLNKN